MIGGNLLHLIKAFLKIEKAATQTSAAERELITKYTSGKLNAAEIGVFEGVNTALIANSLDKNGKMYAIDPFLRVKFGLSYQKKISYTVLKRAKAFNKVVWLEGFSQDVIDQVPAKMDFIFVDGDHSFEGVKRDYDLYQQKLAKDGILAFHDSRLFENGWTNADQGPVRLMNEIILPSNKWQVVDQVDSLVLLKKK
jgi:predicted O-methyltransferase YrrM